MIKAYSPSQNETNVQPSVNSVLTFNAGSSNHDFIKAGTASGSIVLTPSAGSAVSVDVADSQVTISAAVVTVNPMSNLSAGELYTVTIESGVLMHKNHTTLAFAVINGTMYQFNTANTAAITSYSPPMGANTTRTLCDNVLTFS